MLLAHVLHDVVGELVASYTYRLLRGDTTERDDSYLGRTTTYVDYHVALRSKDIYADTDSGSHRLVEHVDVTTASVLA